MYQIPKLDAVNRILRPLNGTTVVDLSTAQTDDDVLQAIKCLDEAVEEIQAEAEWNFNSFGPSTLIADVNGLITLPGNFSYLQFLSWTGGMAHLLEVDGNMVMNTETQSTNLGGTVTVRGTLQRTYDELPGVVQRYAIATAKYNVADNTHLSAPRLQLATVQRQAAQLAAYKWDSNLQNGRILNDPNIRKYNRQPGNGRWDGTL